MEMDYRAVEDVLLIPTLYQERYGSGLGSSRRSTGASVSCMSPSAQPQRCCLLASMLRLSAERLRLLAAKLRLLAVTLCLLAAMLPLLAMTLRLEMSDIIGPPILSARY